MRAGLIVAVAALLAPVVLPAAPATAATPRKCGENRIRFMNRSGTRATCIRVTPRRPAARSAERAVLDATQGTRLWRAFGRAEIDNFIGLQGPALHGWEDRLLARSQQLVRTTPTAVVVPPPEGRRMQAGSVVRQLVAPRGPNTVRDRTSLEGTIVANEVTQGTLELRVASDDHINYCPEPDGTLRGGGYVTVTRVLDGWLGTTSTEFAKIGYILRGTVNDGGKLDSYDLEMNVFAKDANGTSATVTLRAKGLKPGRLLDPKTITLTTSAYSEFSDADRQQLADFAYRGFLLVQRRAEAKLEDAEDVYATRKKCNQPEFTPRRTTLAPGETKKVKVKIKNEPKPASKSPTRFKLKGRGGVIVRPTSVRRRDNGPITVTVSRPAGASVAATPALEVESVSRQGAAESVYPLGGEDVPLFDIVATYRRSGDCTGGTQVVSDDVTTRGALTDAAPDNPRIAIGRGTASGSFQNIAQDCLNPVMRGSFTGRPVDFTAQWADTAHTKLFVGWVNGAYPTYSRTEFIPARNGSTTIRDDAVTIHDVTTITISNLRSSAG